MKTTEVKEFRTKILEALKVELESYEVPAVIRKKEEGLPTDILTTLYRDMGAKSDEVMGEYYFLPIEGNNVDIHCFTVSMTLSEDLPGDKVDLIQDAIRTLNYYLLGGNFLISPDRTSLIYRNTALFKIDLSYDKSMEMIQIAIGVSLQIVEKWVKLLLDLERGEMTLEGFMKYMPN